MYNFHSNRTIIYIYIHYDVVANVDMYVLICAHLYVWKTIGCDTYTINRNRLDTLRRPCGACTGSSDQVVGNNQLLCFKRKNHHVHIDEVQSKSQ
jgi:hypothetical protein